MTRFSQTIKKYWYLAVLLVVLTTVLSLFLSVVQTPKYEATAKLLVIQKQSKSMDAYTAARSAETVAEVLSKMTYTSTFFNYVLETDFNVKDDFGTTEEDRDKNWKDAVHARVVDDTGTLEILVYDEDREQTKNIATAVAYVMIENGKNYHGGDSQIEVKMVDRPTVSENPTKPNIPQNMVFGAVLGLLTSFVLLFLLDGLDDEIGVNYPKKQSKQPVEDLKVKVRRIKKKDSKELKTAKSQISEPINKLDEEQNITEFLESIRENQLTAEQNNVSLKRSNTKETIQPEPEVVEETAEANIFSFNESKILTEEPEAKTEPRPKEVKEEIPTSEPNQDVIGTPTNLPFEDEAEESQLAQESKPQEKASNKPKNKQSEQSKSIMNQNLDSRLDQVITAPKKKADGNLPAGNIAPEDAPQSSAQDPYSPDKVDSWMKTGKFK